MAAATFRPRSEMPADLVPDYYSWVYPHARKSDEILLMEVGWPSGGSDSPSEPVA